MNVAQETLGFRRGSFSLPLSLLMSAFALLIPPASLTEHLRRPTERSPTMQALLLIYYLFPQSLALSFVVTCFLSQQKAQGCCLLIYQQHNKPLNAAREINSLHITELVRVE